MSMLERIADTAGLGWYDNRRPDQMWHEGRQRRMVGIVAMIWGRDAVGKPRLSALRPTHLSGFNEADGRRDGQSDMSVEEAIAPGHGPRPMDCDLEARPRPTGRRWGEIPGWAGRPLRRNLVDNALRLTTLGAAFVRVIEQRGWLAVAAAEGATRTA